jgi:predicted O-methyltransferase YrrM
MEMTDARWLYTKEYLREVFGSEDDRLRTLTAEAARRGLPAIAVSPDVGRLLSILVSLARARTAIEVGTLAGYSAAWIARALGANGRLITIERDPAHADFAEQQLAGAAISARVEVRRGAALDVLPEIARELGDRSVDFAFVDADKREYPEYFRILRPLIREGGIFTADNVLGTSASWIDDESSPDRAGADRLNRLVANDPEFEAIAVPLREGVLIARRRSNGDQAR